MAKKTTTAPPKAAKPKAARKALDPVRLKALADEIGACPVGKLGDLRHRLEVEEGMTARSTTEGRLYVTLAGLEVGARGDTLQAMVNWGNKARRIVLRGEAA